MIHHREAIIQEAIRSWHVSPMTTPVERENGYLFGKKVLPVFC